MMKNEWHAVMDSSMLALSSTEDMLNRHEIVNHLNFEDSAFCRIGYDKIGSFQLVLHRISLQHGIGGYVIGGHTQMDRGNISSWGMKHERTQTQITPSWACFQ